MLWTNEQMPRLGGSDLLAEIRGRARVDIPCVIDSGSSEGWAGRARLAFAAMPLPWDMRYATAIFHEAARLRRAFQYARSPQVLCGARGLAPPPLPPPVGPHRPESPS